MNSPQASSLPGSDRSVRSLPFLLLLLTTALHADTLQLGFRSGTNRVVLRGQDATQQVLATRRDARGDETDATAAVWS